MGANHFVGRGDAVARLTDILGGGVRPPARGRLTVQSVEGPGGVGKTSLFDHALRRVDLAGRGYLALRVDGGDRAAGGGGGDIVRAVARMVDGADAGAIRGRPPGYYFPAVGRVVRAVDAARAEAAAEFALRRPGGNAGLAAIGRLMNAAIAAGKRINDVSAATRRYVDVALLEADLRLAGEAVGGLASLAASRRRLIWGRGAAFRSAIREMPLERLADALVGDLAAVLVRYRPGDWWRATHGKVRGVGRLLLVVDDYEALHHLFGEFLLAHLLPRLRGAGFESVVVVLGRDKLEATDPGWNQNFGGELLPPLDLPPLSRPEMDELVEGHGFASAAEKDRAWRDTQGYPYYVRLWVEEARAGGRAAVMLRQFYERTTRWMGPRERAWLDHALFLAEVNARTLRAVLPPGDDAGAALAWFAGEGSVRDTAAPAFRVREYVRSRLADYLRVTDPDRHADLERRGRAASDG